LSNPLQTTPNVSVQSWHDSERSQFDEDKAESSEKRLENLQPWTQISRQLLLILPENAQS
jgi:hypothetical protein